jgi:hypothetical protein
VISEQFTVTRANFHQRVVNSYLSLFAITQTWRGVENFSTTHDQPSRHYQVKQSEATPGGDIT